MTERCAAYHAERKLAVGPLALAMAVLLLGAVALMAAYLPALRAAKLQPMAALRED